MSTHVTFLRGSLFPVIVTGVMLWTGSDKARGEEVALDIGSRRELFVDGALVERFAGKTELRLHHPVPQEIALVHDAPWEGTGCGYHSLFKDGDRYRMYYKAWQLTVTAPGKVATGEHPTFCCYAESEDGIHWRKPELGLHEFKGSKANNIVFVSEPVGQFKSEPGEPSVFKDENPNAPADSRYKALLRASPKGLLAFKSSDGLHWSPMSDTPVITDGAFDSQNLAFWDAPHGEYRAYWRIFTKGNLYGKPASIRAIRTATSKDFLHWENQKDLKYVDSPDEQLYTSQVRPYFRAPQLYLGFPTRYIERGWSDAMRALPDAENREWRAQASKPSQRYGLAVTEALFMASRDGVLFKRWNEAFLPPGPEHPGSWAYGNQYIGWQMLETKSALSGAPDEISLYATENYWLGAHGSVLRRYTLRMDGFVSAQAPMSGGDLITRPIRFQGKRLALNFATSAAGSVRVELQDAEGHTLPGFSLEDCPPLFGNTLERNVTWTQGADLGALAGKPVRLRFEIKDGDLYSFQFKE